MLLIKPNNMIKWMQIRTFTNLCMKSHQIKTKQIQNFRFLAPIAVNSTINHPAILNFSSTGVIERDNGGFFKRVLKKVGFAENSKARLRASSILLYECVADQINYLEFFQEFDLPNTFNSWFLITELHVHMLLVRAMAEGAETGQDGRFLRNCIVEALWADVSTRAKKLGADNPSNTRSQIETLSEQFQATLITYDEGVAGDDRTLANALWRRFFSKKCKDYSKLEVLVKYVRKQVNLLDSLTREDFLKSRVKWTGLKES